MWKNFKRGVASMNATTKFEKSRMQATYSGDTSPPHEEDIQTIMTTFSGQDPETKALFAIQTIINKLKTSSSRKYWNYVMKNLIILDRAVEDRFFVKEISMIELPEVEEYNAKERYKQKLIEDLVASYFRFIREKAGIYCQVKSALNVPKDKRRQYFKEMQPEDILAEITKLKSLYNLAFEIFSTGANGHLKYKLNQYVFLVVLSSVMNILSTQYVAFIVIVENFFEMDIHLASDSYLEFKEFLKGTEELILFTGNHQFIPGFQISLHELRNPTADAKLLNSMQEYIKLLEEESKGNGPRPSVDAFDIPRSELQPKKSEINIAMFAEQFVAEKYASDEENNADNVNSSPPKSSTKSGEEFFQNARDNVVKKASSLTSGQKRAVTALFESTLQVGFHSLIAIENALIEQTLDEYKTNEEQGENENNGTAEQPLQTSEISPLERHLTPAFKRLLLIDTEEDHIFNSFQNFYSSEETGSPNTLSPLRYAKPYFEFKTLGFVLTKCDNYKTNEDVGVAMIDFNADIFNSFKNLYSYEFRA